MRQMTQNGVAASSFKTDHLKAGFDEVSIVNWTSSSGDWRLV
jgi:hypothetical protein